MPEVTDTKFLRTKNATLTNNFLKGVHLNNHDLEKALNLYTHDTHDKSKVSIIGSAKIHFQNSSE